MKMCFLDYGRFNCPRNFGVLPWFPHLTCGPAAWTSAPLETRCGAGVRLQERSGTFGYFALGNQKGRIL